MAIQNAVKRGSTVYVYGDKGRLLFTQSGDLHGYTGGSVSIKRSSTIYVYDEKGRLQNTTSAR